MDSTDSTGTTDAGDTGDVRAARDAAGTWDTAMAASRLAPAAPGPLTQPPPQTGAVVAGPLPAPTGPGRRRRWVKPVAVALAVLLTLGAAGGVGWHLWSRSQAGTTTTTGLVTLSDAWLTGAHQLWQQDVDPEAEVVVLGDHLLTFLTARGKYGRHEGTTVTGYTVSQEGMTQRWAAQLPDDERSTSTDTVLAWGGSTAVYGSTLIDLDTGSMRSAPWGKGLMANIAGSTAVSCAEDDTCTAWDENGRRLWRLSVRDSGPPPDESSSHYSSRGHTTGFYEPVAQYGDDRFIVIASTVVNLDTGEKLALRNPDLGKGRIAYIEPAQDGWAVVASTEDNQYRVTTYTVEGERIESFSARTPENTFPVVGQESMRTLKQIRSDMETMTSTSTGVTLTLSSDGCIKTITVGDRPLFPPKVAKDGPATCATWARLSSWGSAAVLHTHTLNPMNAVSSIMDLRSGEIVDIPGSDPGRSVYIASSPSLLVAVSDEGSSLTAYAPGS